LGANEAPAVCSMPWSGQPAVVDQRLEAAQDSGRPVAVLPDAVDEVAARQVQLFFRDGLALVFQQVAGVAPQHLFNLL